MSSTELDFEVTGPGFAVTLPGEYGLLPAAPTAPELRQYAPAGKPVVVSVYPQDFLLTGSLKLEGALGLIERSLDERGGVETASVVERDGPNGRIRTAVLRALSSGSTVAVALLDTGGRTAAVVEVAYPSGLAEEYEDLARTITGSLRAQS